MSLHLWISDNVHACTYVLGMVWRGRLIESWVDFFISNVVLLEAPFHTERAPQRNSVLLTVDLTRGVAEEAIRKRVSVVVAYRESPFFFFFLVLVVGWG